jgi:hypothetical protein
MNWRELDRQIEGCGHSIPGARKPMLSRSPSLRLGSVNLSCGRKDGRLYFLTYLVTPLSCASAV